MSNASNNVFTVFFHGTAFSRSTDANETITQLSEAALGNEARIIQVETPSKENPLPYRLESAMPDHLICEGPGSASSSASDSAFGVAHARPGVFNPFLNIEKNPGKAHIFNPALIPKGGRAYWLIGGKTTDTFQDHFMGNTDGNWRHKGLLLGEGWDDNVYKTVWLLTHLKWSQGMPIDTVNLVGWSRGAVTCIKTANKMFEVFEDTIKVNIFAIDPVPGGINKITDDIRFIPPNVQDYVAVLALDENGNLFEAMDRTTTQLMAPRSQHGLEGNPESLNPERLKPRVHFLPFPGNHSDVVNVDLSSPEVGDSAILIRHLAWRFLAEHGTSFSTDFALERGVMLEMYRGLMENLQHIAKKARIWLVGSHGYEKEREVSTFRERYVELPQDYLNEHHRLLELGADYQVTENAELAFSPEDWADWNADQTINDWSEWVGGKSLPLPAYQSDLRAMGMD